MVCPVEEDLAGMALGEAGFSSVVIDGDMMRMGNLGEVGLVALE